MCPSKVHALRHNIYKRKGKLNAHLVLEVGTLGGD